MNRFAGKFSFFYGELMLVYFSNRAGLIAKTRTTIHDSAFNVQPLPPDASKFLAYEQDDGTFTLQAYNGELLAFGDVETDARISTVTTDPSGYPKYHVKTSVPRFKLAPLREARATGTWTAPLRFTVKPRRGGSDVTGCLVPSFDGRAPEYDMMMTLTTNLDSSQAPHGWTFVQYADGVDEIQKAKKVTLFDFAPAGQAVVDLSGQEFREVNFGRSDLRRAKLVGTTMFRCSFENARFEKANLDQAKVLGGYWDCVDFTDATMNAAVLDNLNGRGCNFTRCDLSTVTYTTAMSIKSPPGMPTRFTQAKLNYGWIGRIWSGMILEDAEINQLDQVPEEQELLAQNTDLSGVNLSNLRCKKADFTGATMFGTRLVGARLPNAIFQGARLDGGQGRFVTDFTGAQLPGAQFQNAQLGGVIFAGTRLDQARFEGAILRDANFSNAFLQSVSFAGVEQKMMAGANFSRAFLMGCDFSGADLTNDGLKQVNLGQAYLHGANFTAAKLSGTILSGAGVPQESGEIMVKIGDLPPYPVDYDPTIIDPLAVTSAATTCPNGKPGPCGWDKMKTPFPDAWPWPWSKEKE